jgi:hypothetical protein
MVELVEYVLAPMVMGLDCQKVGDFVEQNWAKINKM